MKIRYLLLTLLLAGGACVMNPTVDSIVADGGRVVTGGVGELVSDGDVTFKAVDGTWAVYFSADGEKRVYIKPRDERVTLSWRRTDDGIFCEEMYDPREEACDGEDKVVVQSTDGVVSVFTDGKKGKYPFTVSEGNTDAL